MRLLRCGGGGNRDLRHGLILQLVMYVGNDHDLEGVDYDESY